MKNLIIRWFKVYEDEIELFVWMALLLLFIRSSNIVLNNFVETAFLKRYGVQYLPVITAINAVATFFLLSSLGGIIARVRSDRMIARSLIACGLVVGLLRFAIPLGLDLIYPVLYVLKTQLDVLLTFIFWNLANDLFSTRQSKRLFPLITAGGIVGGIIGSFGTPWIASLVSLDNLLLVFPLLTLAAALSAWRLGLVAPGGSLWEQQEKGGEKKSILQEISKVGPLIKSSTLAQVLLLLALLPNIVIPVLNYQFNFVVDQTFGTEAGMLGFYSYFRGAQNTISLVLILFVGRIFGRFGLPMALMFHPFNYLLAFTAYLLQFNIFSAIYAGTSVGVIRRTINGPATAALYGLLLPKDRNILRPFLLGTVVRCGILIGSGIVWLGAAAMHPRYLSLLAIGFVVLWLAATLLLKRRYSLILLNLIRGGLPDFYRMNRKELQKLFRGVNVGPVLLERLRGSSGEEAAWYADVLRSNRIAGLDAVILEKLPQSDDDTRIRLLPYLSEQSGERSLTVFRTLIDSTRPELLVALAKAAKRMTAQLPTAMEQEMFAAAADPEVQACFLGWKRAGDPAGLLRLIDGWLQSELLAERRAAVLAISEQGLVEYTQRVCQLLEVESDPALLCLVLRVLPTLKVADRGGRVRRFLRHAEWKVRLAAVDVFPLATEAAVTALIPLLGDPINQVRQQAIQRLGTVARPLYPVQVAAMGNCSRRVLDGLFQVARILEIEEIDMVRFCRRQLKVACRVVDLSNWLVDAPPGASRELLLIHLEEVRRQRVDNVVRGLAARDKSGRLETILRGLNSAGAREQGDSVEALDALLDQRLSRILLPQLENQSSAEQLAVGRRYLRHLQLATSQRDAIDKLLQDENDVSVILTLELLIDWGRINEFRCRIEELTRAESPFVATMAVGALQEVKENDMDAEEELVRLPERMLHLRKIDLFQDLSVNELSAIALVADEVFLPSDTQVTGGKMACRSGAGTCECLHVLISGEVVVEHDLSNRSVPVARWGAGQSFGISALFGMNQVTMSVRTVQESVILRIYQQDFSALLKEYPEIALRMCQVLAGRLGGVVDELSRVTQEFGGEIKHGEPCCGEPPAIDSQKNQEAG